MPQQVTKFPYFWQHYSYLQISSISPYAASRLSNRTLSRTRRQRKHYVEHVQIVEPSRELRHVLTPWLEENNLTSIFRAALFHKARLEYNRTALVLAVSPPLKRAAKIVCALFTSIIVMEWTQKKCLILICAYESRDILWNPKHPHYFNKLKRQDAWSEIAAELDFEVEPCKRKMTALLASLRREKGKIRKSEGTGKSADDIYNSSWFAFKPMQFLYDKDKPVDATNCATFDQTADSDADDVSTEEKNSFETHSTNSSQASPKPTPDKKRKRKESRYIDDPYEFHDDCATSSRSAPDDESQDFGNFVAKKLRKYDDLTRSYIQNEILSTFLNVDRSFHNQTQNPSLIQSHPHGNTSAASLHSSPPSTTHISNDTLAPASTSDIATPILSTEGKNVCN